MVIDLLAKPNGHVMVKILTMAHKLCPYLPLPQTPLTLRCAAQFKHNPITAVPYPTSISTPQIAFLLSSKHYPSPDHMGDLYSVSPTEQGTPPYDHQLGLLSFQQSVMSESIRSRTSASSYMLVDQHNGNILPIFRELVECFLDRRILRLGVHDEEVLLIIRRLRDVLRFE